MGAGIGVHPKVGIPAITIIIMLWVGISLSFKRVPTTLWRKIMVIKYAVIRSNKIVVRGKEVITTAVLKAPGLRGKCLR